MGSVSDEFRRLKAEEEQRKAQQRRSEAARRVAEEAEARRQRALEAEMQSAIMRDTEATVVAGRIRESLEETRRLWGCGEIKDYAYPTHRVIALVYSYQTVGYERSGDYQEKVTSSVSTSVGFHISKDNSVYFLSRGRWVNSPLDRRMFRNAEGGKLAEFVTQLLAADYKYRLEERRVPFW